MSGRSHQSRFLRDLAALPLKSGRVTIVGNPTRADVPITPGMLVHYAAWLQVERQLVMRASTGSFEGPDGFDPWSYPVWGFSNRYGFELEADARLAQRRAPVVLSAVGCPLTSAKAEEDWGGTFDVQRGIGRAVG